MKLTSETVGLLRLNQAGALEREAVRNGPSKRRLTKDAWPSRYMDRVCPSTPRNHNPDLQAQSDPTPSSKPSRERRVRQKVPSRAQRPNIATSDGDGSQMRVIVCLEEGQFEVDER